MSGSGKQKKGKRKLYSNKPSNKSGKPRVEPCPELGPKHCDSDTGPELSGMEDTIGMHTNSKHSRSSNPKPSRSSNPLINNPMYCSEVELKNILMDKLESVYEQAIAQLISFGYSPDLAWNAIDTSGCVFGDEDILTNIVQSSLEYIRTKKSRRKGTRKCCPQVDESLKPTVQNSLAMLLFTLCQARPNMKRRDAMRHLLMTDFDLGFASILKVLGKKKDGTIQVEITPGASSSESATVQGDQKSADCENSSFGNKMPAEELEKFSGKSRFSVTDFNLTPSEQARLRKSIANFGVAYRASMKVSSDETQAKNNSFPGFMSTDQFEWEDSCLDNLMLDCIGSSSFDKESTGESVEQKTEMISILVQKIKEAKVQAKERKEWAGMKVVEAAKKISQCLLELKALRIETRKQKYKPESGMREQEERMMLRLLELETAMDQTIGQYDMLKKASNDMENGNSEIRAEIKAYNLRTSESDEKLAKVATEEKKSIKKMMSLEKHNRRLLEEIEQERKKCLELQKQVVDLKVAHEDKEVMWRQEVKAKELAVKELREERRLKEEAEVRIKRRQQAFRQEMEADRRKHKGEVELLEQEIARLEMSSEASHDKTDLPDYLFSWESEVLLTNADNFQNQLPGSSEQTGISENEVSYDRVCMICMEKEVSVLFLPCAHQVLCAKCNNNCSNELEARCPSCKVPIDARVHIYGVRS